MADDSGAPYAVHAEARRDEILTSVLKRTDVAVHEVRAEFARGEFHPGPRRSDLASGGIDTSNRGGYLEDIRPQLEAARGEIVAGRIVSRCLAPAPASSPPPDRL